MLAIVDKPELGLSDDTPSVEALPATLIVQQNIVHMEVLQYLTLSTQTHVCAACST